MVKRLIDVVLAGIALVAAAPVLAIAAVAIRLASPGPILYRLRLVGRHGRPFTMYKLRTMHVEQGRYRSCITAQDDPRVFPLGRWLRRSKLDELPQLVNILRGEMAVVGPRPENPAIVAAHYTPADCETLAVRPGLTSPATLYDYTHGEQLIGSADPERAYVERFLPVRLALDRIYVRQASLAYDVALIGRTLWLIGATLVGKRTFREPREMPAAQELLNCSSST